MRREGVKLLKAEYGSDEEASRAIDSGLRTFYASRNDIDARALAPLSRSNAAPGWPSTAELLDAAERWYHGGEPGYARRIAEIEDLRDRLARPPD